MVINSFSGTYRFLSNFWLAPITVGLTFPSNEHAFVYFKNPECWKDEWMELTPGQVKRKGKPPEKGGEVVLREGWDDIRVLIMTMIVFCKFLQNSELRAMLLATGDATLIEGNHWGDTFWGVCDGEGENHLGKILMEVRQHLRGLELSDAV